MANWPFQKCDRLFEGGEVADGAGGEPYPASVAVLGERIVAVGDLRDWKASERIDIEGLTLCPGFIDCHTHDDQALFATPDMTPKVSQGVTTVVTGNCGVSLAPLVVDGLPPQPLSEVGRSGDFRFATFAAYLDALEAQPAAVNAACLVGHTTLRVATMAQLDRPANSDEADRMDLLCREAMAAGAIGLSSGLYYPPAKAAQADEVIRLVRIAAASNGVYTAHIRDEGDDVAEALEEAFHIASEGNALLIVSHHKVMGHANAGRSRETLLALARASTTLAVAFDVYPYVASSTMLEKAQLNDNCPILVSWSARRPDMAGRYLSDVAAEMHVTLEEAMDALTPGGGIYFKMDEADVRRILSSPYAMIGSDGLPFSQMPHPRLWGTFTRVLGRYARDEGLFTFGEAVRRMTGLTAARFGLRDRGLIAPGAYADMVVLDRRRVVDAATFENPMRPSEGISRVCVNGVDVWRDRKPTGARPGRVLSPGGRVRSQPSTN